MTDHELNERCAKAFEFKLQRAAHYEYYETPYHKESTFYPYETRIKELPDFANSPEWCWRAWEELFKRFGFGVTERINHAGAPLVELLSAARLRKATLLAFCEWKESQE